MTRYILIMAALAFTLKLSATETNSPPPMTIGAGAAHKYFGQEMIVTGKVVQVILRPKVALLNLDQPYPNSPFMLFIFPDQTNQFVNLKSLIGKNVEARGKITEFNRKPEIKLENTNQLKVLGLTK